MQNPFRTEAAAYRFVLATIAFFGAIVAASVLGGTWAGLAVFIVLSLVYGWWFFLRGGPEEPERITPVHRGGPDEKRILVVANETVGGRRLREEITRSAEGFRADVLVVCPALNSPLKHWVSDEDEARARAQQRLDDGLRRLREAGIEASGQVGDGEPLQAIEDALRTFGADEIILSTHPEGRSHWLERGVVGAARERFDVPITHVVVDLDAEGEEVR